MSAGPLLPQAFWFRLSIPCPRVDAMPKAGSKGRLLDLPESCTLPDFGRLEGKPSWAEVRIGWNPKGLGVAVEATGKSGAVGALADESGPAEGLQLWIDTRDTRDVHRATRFCHRFLASIAPSSVGGGLKVKVEPKPIARAIADAPTAKPDAFSARAEATRKGWRLELFLPAEALNGFDPDTNRRLGLMFQVIDPGREDQYLGVGREFPVGEDPSLWATLELRD